MNNDLDELVTVTLPFLRVLYCSCYRLSGTMSALWKPLLNSTEGVNKLEGGEGLFGQGYRHAASRSYQLEVQRRTSLGTLSELLGDNYLQSDLMYVYMHMYVFIYVRRIQVRIACKYFHDVCICMYS